jgi:hypothetical protein
MSGVVVAIGVALVVTFAGVWLLRPRAWPSDAEVLHIMRQDGVDTSRAQRLEFDLRFPTREAAAEAQPALAALGFEARVSGGPGAPHPLLSASRTLVPTEQALRDVRVQLVAFARAHGAEYRGCVPRP